MADNRKEYQEFEHRKHDRQIEHEKTDTRLQNRKRVAGVLSYSFMVIALFAVAMFIFFGGNITDYGTVEKVDMKDINGEVLKADDGSDIELSKFEFPSQDTAFLFLNNAFHRVNIVSDFVNAVSSVKDIFGNNGYTITFFYDLVDGERVNRQYIISNCNNNLVLKNYEVFASSLSGVSYFRQNLIGDFKLMNDNFNVVYSYKQQNAAIFYSPHNLNEFTLFYPLENLSDGLDIGSDWVDDGLLPAYSG